MSASDVKLTATIEFKVPIPKGAQVFAHGYTETMTLGVKVIGDERDELDAMADEVLASLLDGLTEVVAARASVSAAGEHGDDAKEDE